MSNPSQKMLYNAIGVVVLFVVTLYATDYIFGLIKPDCIKINGKIDKNRQFLYSLGISSSILLIIILVLYQILA